MTDTQDNIQRPNSYNYINGIDLAKEGKLSEALESFEKELKDNPKNGYAYYWIGAIYHDMEEYGDALHCFLNYGRWLGIDPNIALQRAMKKFEFRFKTVEEGMKKRKLEMDHKYHLDMMEFWNQAKGIR